LAAAMVWLTLAELIRLMVPEPWMSVQPVALVLPAEWTARES